MRPSAAFTSALLLSSTCLAWPFDWESVKREIAPILKRQTTSFNLSFTPTSGTQGDTAATSSPTSDESTDATDTTDATTTGTGTTVTLTDSPTDSTATQTGTDTNAPTGTSATTGASQTPAPTGSTTAGNNTSSPTFAATVPAGGISMITPNVYTTEYFKISDYITLAWNYTSVSRLPTAIDILAVGALNSATYTWALNQSVSTPTQSFVFDSKAYQANATTQLLTQTYTLIVHDAAKDVSATPQPGYLGTANQFIFAMYLPSSYRSEEQGWQCVTCSGAMANAGRQELRVVFGVVAVTVLSFTWFAGVAGLW